MEYEELTVLLSVPRLKRYLDVSGGDKHLAIHYYLANIRLAKAFLPMLHLFEVGLRNVVNSGISHHLNDEKWIINKTQDDHYLGMDGNNHSKLRKDVREILERRRGKDQAQSEAGIISDTTLGFWAEVFHDKYRTALANSPISSFLNRQTGHNMNTFHSSICSIRDFRNRVTHHESLIIATTQNNGKSMQRLHLNYAKDARNRILSVSEQIDPNLRKVISSLDGVQAELSRISELSKDPP
jgi:hypothetical protein